MSNFKFSPVSPNANYSVRYQSACGKYEVGLTPMLFGVRVRAGRTSCDFADVDYCAGADTVFQWQLLATIITILEKFPDTAQSSEICAVMPSYERKPINLDPCWAKLRQLASSN